MTERYTQKWMGDFGIMSVLMCSQMDKLNPQQQEWLEQVVTRIQAMGEYKYDSFGSKGRKPLRLLAESMQDIQKVGRKSRRWIILENAKVIARLEK